jgi:hypothetical protein
MVADERHDRVLVWVLPWSFAGDGDGYGFDEEEQGVNCRLKIADGVMVMAV